MANQQYQVGSLVTVRDREWIVLPESTADWLMVRPMGGTSEEVTGIYLPLEKVEPTVFALPDPNQPGDYRSCRLLRDAIRLGFRNSTGPFRSFAKLGVEPRHYQLVPMLMALRMDPVRLLIADDVGIGKTIEAGVIARELLDRGEIQRMAVICPPHLVDQWQEELSEKFHIDTQPITASSANRLEHNCTIGQTLFDIYPYVVVSLDFIKTDKRRDDFKRTCPELVIIDEAHTCSFGNVGKGRQQRHQLVKGLAQNPKRHMILLTATPHSGKETAFRSLLSILDQDFENMPEQLDEKQHETFLRRIAKHLVQRRRQDITSYLDENTPFPVRETLEESYKLSPEYKQLFDRVLDYTRESVREEEGGLKNQRVRWWSALALLRALASSPAAAAATLRTRSAPADALNADEADDIGKRMVLDLVQDEAEDSPDITPGSQTQPDEHNPQRQKLLKMAREADALKGIKDSKLQKGIQIIKSLLKDGFRPVVFCRFIHTAEYLTEELKLALDENVKVSAVTGLLPPAEREHRVKSLAQCKYPVLVTTDCLSEGINLQDFFDAVFHYDLSWNPTRHEQREGRVDRFLQNSPSVRVVTFYGLDNQIDGIVLDVLIRKHKAIRDSLKISIPVPTDSNQLVEAIFEGLLLREHAGKNDRIIPQFEEFFKPKRDKLYIEWEALSKEEEKLRSLFTHSSIKVQDVATELNAVRYAMGTSSDVSYFFNFAMEAYQVPVKKEINYKYFIQDAPPALKEALDLQDKESIRARFHAPAGQGIMYLHRTHPIVQGLARFILDGALDRESASPAKRCGVIRTDAVDKRTTLLLVRFRFHIKGSGGSERPPLLAEECGILGFKGAPTNPEWLTIQHAETLMDAIPKQNTTLDDARYFLEKIITQDNAIKPYLESQAIKRAQVLANDHSRVMATMKHKISTIHVEPVGSPDMLGIYIYLPASNIPGQE